MAWQIASVRLAGWLRPSRLSIYLIYSAIYLSIYSFIQIPGPFAIWLCISLPPKSNIQIFKSTRSSHFAFRISHLVSSDTYSGCKPTPLRCSRIGNGRSRPRLSTAQYSTVSIHPPTRKHIPLHLGFGLTDPVHPNLNLHLKLVATPCLCFGFKSV
jgi:hypothetical protein